MTPSKKDTPKTKSSSSEEYAIVETSGRQFWLEANRYYEFDRIDASIDDTITLDKVLLVSNEKGTTVGKPYVSGASVKIKIMSHRRGPKVIVYKMRPKKKTRRKNGHRQELTRVMVEAISSGTNTKKASKPLDQTKKEPSKVKSSKEEATKAAPKTPPKK